MSVVIGVDPHKASHTAVVVDEQEKVLGRLRVQASSVQAEQLCAWAETWPERSWAIEGAAGLGFLLAQQLVAAGEQVVDVQPKLAARVRLLNTGQVNKNDPNDARSVAVAALRGRDLPLVRREDHAAVMRVWVRRRRDLARTRNRVANRLHTLLCELVPGGFAGEISAPQAIALLSRIHPQGAADAARHELAADLVDDLHRLDRQLKAVRASLITLVAASQPAPRTSSASDRLSPPPSSAPLATSIASLPPIGLPPTPAPRRSKPLPARARSTDSPDAGTGSSTTPCTWPPLPRSATGAPLAAPTTTARSAKV